MLLCTALCLFASCAHLKFADIVSFFQTCLIRLWRIFSSEFNFPDFISCRAQPFLDQKLQTIFLRTSSSVLYVFCKSKPFLNRIFLMKLCQISVSAFCPLWRSVKSGMDCCFQIFLHGHCPIFGSSSVILVLKTPFCPLNLEPIIATILQFSVPSRLASFLVGWGLLFSEASNKAMPDFCVRLLLPFSVSSTNLRTSLIYTPLALPVLTNKILRYMMSGFSCSISWIVAVPSYYVSSAIVIFLIANDMLHYVLVSSIASF